MCVGVVCVCLVWCANVWCVYVQGVNVWFIFGVFVMNVCACVQLEVLA